MGFILLVCEADSEASGFWLFASAAFNTAGLWNSWIKMNQSAAIWFILRCQMTSFWIPTDIYLAVSSDQGLSPFLLM